MVGFVYDLGTFGPPLVYPGARATYPSGINDRGEIAGSYYDAHGTSHGFLYKATKFLTLDAPAAQTTGFEDINDSGQLSGVISDAAGTHGILYLEPVGLYSPALNFPGSTLTYPQAINNAGEVGGQYNTPAGVGLPFVSLAGALVTINLPGAVSASVMAINDRGRIAGNFIDANQVHHGYIAALPL